MPASITRANTGWSRMKRDGTCCSKKTSHGWQAQYRFSLTPYGLSDFSSRCRYHQTSPESTFTQKSVCTLATQEGRITLSNGRLIRTGKKGKTEQVIESADEYKRLLADLFRIRLPEDWNIAQELLAK